MITATISKEQRTLKAGTIWLLLLIVGLFILLRMGMAKLAITRDEGAYAYISTRLLEGDVPYRDLWDHKPPAIYFTYAAAIGLFGATPHSLHILAALAQSIGLCLLFLMARRLYGLSAAFATAIFYAFAQLTQDSAGINTEIFVALCSIAGFYSFLLYSDRRRWWWAWLTGVAFGLGVMYKQVALPDFVALWLFWIWSIWRQWPLSFPFWHILRAMLIMVVGFLLPILAFVAYFAGHNALSEFYFDTYVYNTLYIDGTGIVFRLKRAILQLTKFGQIHLPLCAAALAGIVGLFKSGDAIERRLPLFWLGGSIVGIIISPYFFEHYFIQILAPLALLAGRPVGEIASDFLKGNREQRTQPLMLFVLFIAVGGLINYGAAYASAFREETRPVNPALRETIAYIQQHTAEDDSIFIWGDEPQIYFESGRRSASKYISSYPLTRAMYVYPDGAERLQRELTEQEVELILVMPHTIAEPPPFLQDLLASSYHFEAAVGGMDIYRLMQTSSQ